MTFDLNTLWKETEAASKDDQKYDVRPDGKYRAVIDDAEYGQSRQGNWGVKWTLSVPGEKGKEFKWSSLRPYPEYFADDVKWLKHDLDVFDLECDDFDDLQSTLDMAVGKSVKIEIKTVGAKNFRVINFIEEMHDTKKRTPKVDRDKYPAHVPDHSVEPDDDIPF